MVEESGLDIAGLEFHRRRRWVPEANWKVAIENHLECYHCPVAHPGFSAIVDVGARGDIGPRLRAAGSASV